MNTNKVYTMLQFNQNLQYFEDSHIANRLVVGLHPSNWRLKVLRPTISGRHGILFLKMRKQSARYIYINFTFKFAPSRLAPSKFALVRSAP